MWKITLTTHLRAQTYGRSWIDSKKLQANNLYINLNQNTMKKLNNNTIDKVVFWSIVGIFVPMILGGIFTIIKNIDLVSFNF